MISEEKNSKVVGTLENFVKILTFQNFIKINTQRFSNMLITNLDSVL